eukprot:scaffold1508_cov178-Amphora_coffeaeformis.AAC.25
MALPSLFLRPNSMHSPFKDTEFYERAPTFTGLKLSKSSRTMILARTDPSTFDGFVSIARNPQASAALPFPTK